MTSRTPKSEMKLLDTGYLQEITRESSRASLNGFQYAHSYEDQENTEELLGSADSGRHIRAGPSGNPFRDDESRRMLIETNKDLRINQYQSVTVYVGLGYTE